MDNRNRKNKIRYKRRMRKREAKPKYIAKCYRPLHAQLQCLRFGSIGFMMADALYDSTNRQGFMRRFLDPEGSKQRDAEYEIKRQERQVIKVKERDLMKEVYLKYYVPYHRNKRSYTLIPDALMHQLGFHNIQDQGSKILNQAFKKGWQ